MKAVIESTLLAVVLFLIVVACAAIWQRITATDKITLQRSEWRCTLWRQVEGIEARRCVTYRRIEVEQTKGTGT